MVNASQVLLDQMKRLWSPPTNARSFLVIDDYSRGSPLLSWADVFKTNVFKGLANWHYGRPHLRVGFIDFYTLWAAILGTSPGYAAFGYTSPGGCVVNSSSTAGMCEDVNHTFSYIPKYAAVSFDDLSLTLPPAILASRRIA